MDPLATIKRVKAEMTKFSEKFKHLCEIKMIKNSRKNIDNMENPKPGYYWYNCVTRDNLPKVLEDKPTCHIHATMVDKGQRDKGGVSLTP